ncbi:nucleotide disphospho-sugar-binding domain-containing protein [Amycolatopsis magusensis]|uniref:nucleotide disphospho-sugar-binding domain-containing protein n=1 Tax=Amycolatopsis magusensis TaxID=882444 RepID=UPI0024A99B08|nr:nucleotide disphospho-sugar-binding domain-containing protein [Amycolatopsis magusensis]MDI5982614.1 DUF1205 domain-containing protein [Amycolatopsis magusensis]
MRLLFVPLPFPTHYFPTAGLAWAARLAGHDVRVATGADVAPVVDASGVPVVEVNTRPELIADSSRNRKWLELEQSSPGEGLLGALVSGPIDNYARVAAAMADDLIALGRRWKPDLVVSDPLAYAGFLTADVLGVPAVRHLWGVDSTRHFRLPGSGFDASVPSEEMPWSAIPWPDRLTGLFAEHGATPRDDLAVATVDPCPESLQYPGASGRLPVRYTPYNGAGVIPDWVLDEPARPRVALTWGLASTATLGDEFFGLPRIIEAIAPLDIEVVVAISPADRPRLGPLPPNVRAASVPLHALLPTCSAIVHHGGSGTLFTAACYGVPQLTLALMHEHKTAASRFARQGSGILLGENETAPETIRTRLEELLTGDPTRKAAADLATEIATQPSPPEVAEALTHLP